ncbi:MAG: helix-turn-helix domain-containing protein [Candidatus Aenigmarchaeota archaeon]|nr:helix-turn-helix domain-containing protein [Candidatus Aenigmarchaeota archaeon]
MQQQIRAYKFRLYPSKKQIEALNHHIWISKELWNRMLETTKKLYEKEKRFPSKKELREIVKDSLLYSQVSQELVDRLLDAVKRKIRMKMKGLKAGFPRFKSFYQMKSLNYPQFGFSFSDQKLRVTPFGEISIKKHRDMKGKIKTLSLKREQTGKWFAVFTVVEPKSEPKSNNRTKIKQWPGSWH